MQLKNSNSVVYIMATKISNPSVESIKKMGCNWNKENKQERPSADKYLVISKILYEIRNAINTVVESLFS